MKKILFALVALTFSLAMSAQQKTHWGLEVGYDHSWLKSTVWVDKTSESLATKCDMNGFHVGPTMVHDFLSGKHIPSISVGLFYQFMASYYPLGMTGSAYKDWQKNGRTVLEKSGASNVKVSNTIYSHAIQIPVNARYTFRPNENFGLFVYTGPMFNIYASRYAKMNVTGYLNGRKNGIEEYEGITSTKHTNTVWLDGEKTVNDLTDPEDSKTSKNFTLYWDLGIGVNFCKYFSASISYDTCISNQCWLTKSGAANYDMRDDFLKLSLGFTF